jgi:hypothetical protein
MILSNKPYLIFTCFLVSQTASLLRWYAALAWPWAAERMAPGQCSFHNILSDKAANVRAAGRMLVFKLFYIKFLSIYMGFYAWSHMVKHQMYGVSFKFSMMNHDINFGHSWNIFRCSVGTALHSLGICYHLQHKFAQAQTCYEVTFCALISFYFFVQFL